MDWQEVATAIVVGGAILYVVYKMTGGFGRDARRAKSSAGCHGCDSCD